MELERGEDIDLVRSAIASAPSDRHRILEQAKSRVDRISLRSREAVEALASFYEHIESNPSGSLAFRYITNAQVGTERLSPVPSRRPAISEWERLRTDSLEPDVAQQTIGGIRKILESSQKPKDLADTTWSRWRKFLGQASDIQLLDFIRRVEWSTNNPGHDDLERTIWDTLMTTGKAVTLEAAKSIYQRLFLHVFKTLAQTGIKRISASDLIPLVTGVVFSQEDEIMLRTIWRTLEELQGEVSQIQHALLSHQSAIGELNNRVRQLAEARGLSASIGDVITYPIVDTPPVVDHCVPRSAVVARFLKLLESTAWLAIHGTVGTGKTHLASLVARALGSDNACLRFGAEMSPAESCLLLDSGLAVVSGVNPYLNWGQWCNEAVGKLQSGTLLVLDDLPNLTDATSLMDRLAVLASACHSHGVKIFSTSHYVLPARLKSVVPSSAVFEEKVPLFSDEEIRELLSAYSAPHYWKTDRAVDVLVMATHRHPQLLTVAVQHLQSQEWEPSRDAFAQLVLGEYATQQSMEVQTWVIRTVPDEDSRELLYRLTLIGRSFTTEDVKLVSAVSPAVPHPLEKVNNALGLWLQYDARDALVISPLLKRLGSPNLASDTRKGTHVALARRLLGKRVLAPPEMLRAITHLVDAEEFDDAGIILTTVLHSFADKKGQVPDWGFTSIWYDMPLPRSMSPEIQAFVRVAQLRACAVCDKDTAHLVQDFDNLAHQTEPSVYGLLCLTTSIAFVQKAPLLACKYAMEALRRLRDTTQPKEIESILQQHSPEELIWLAGADVESIESLEAWVACLEQLSQDDLKRLFACDIADTTAQFMIERIVMNEDQKPAAERDTENILRRLRDVSARTKAIGAELLWGALCRGVVTILTAHKKAFAEAKAFAQSALAIAVDDPRVHFLIAESLGRNLVGKDSESRTWLEYALAQSPPAYQDLRALALLSLSQEVGSTDPHLAESYAAKASLMVLSKSEEDAEGGEQFDAIVLLETAIAHWLAGDLAQAFCSVDGAAKKLLYHRDDSVSWKSLYLLASHITGYLSALANRGEPPSHTKDGSPFAAPRRGMFLDHDPAISQGYKGDFWNLAVQVALYAQGLGRHYDATRWALLAFDFSREAENDAWLTLLGPQVVSHLIVEWKLEEAFDFALATGISYVATRKAISENRLELQTRFKSSEILGSKSEPEWRMAEEWAAICGLVPLFLQLCICYLDESLDLNHKVSAAVKACRQVALNVGNAALWNEAASLLEAIFLESSSWQTLARRGSEFVRSDQFALRAIAYVGSTLRAPVSRAIEGQLTILWGLRTPFMQHPCLCQTHAIPFVSKFWTSRFAASRFSFQAPQLVEQALGEALGSPMENRLQRVLSVIAAGLGTKVPDGIQNWLGGR